MLKRITKASPQPGYRVELTFEDGEVVIADFNSVTRRGGVFVPMANPEFFSQVRVEEGGRVLSWPGDLEFCADALWLETKAPVLASH